jgi:hypothetical protein
MTGKGINSEENKLLKVFENKISELKEENKQLNQSVKKNAHDQKQPNENVPNPENIVATSSFVDLILTNERSSPDGQEIDEHEYYSLGQNISNNNGSEGELDKKTFSMDLEKDKDTLLENNKYVLIQRIQSDTVAFPGTLRKV